MYFELLTETNRLGFRTSNELVQNFACVLSRCCFSLGTCLAEKVFFMISVAESGFVKRCMNTEMGAENFAAVLHLQNILGDGNFIVIDSSC